MNIKQNQIKIRPSSPHKSLPINSDSLSIFLLAHHLWPSEEICTKARKKKEVGKKNRLWSLFTSTNSISCLWPASHSDGRIRQTCRSTRPGTNPARGHSGLMGESTIREPFHIKTLSSPNKPPCPTAPNYNPGGKKISGKVIKFEEVTPEIWRGTAALGAGWMFAAFY